MVLRPSENFDVNRASRVSWSEARRAPIHENLDYDLYYIENQSTFLDTVILRMTLMAVFRGRGWQFVSVNVRASCHDVG